MRILPIALAFIMISAAGYAIPQMIDFQGKLADSLNVPQTGVFTMHFAIYNQSSSGTLLWQENKSVAVSNGLFSTLLGSINPINTTFAEDYFVEINVSGEVFTPRYRLTSVPYAFRANISESAMSTSINSPSFIIRRIPGQTANLTEWRNFSGNVISYVNVDGQFVGSFVGDGSGLTGVGLVNATQNLSAANITAGTFGADVGGGSYRFPSNLTVLGNFSVANIFFVNTLLNFIGIGTVTPQYRLDVNGTINAHALLVNGTSFSNNLTGSGTTGYIPQFQAPGILNNSIIYQNGTNVGIGTTSPSEKFEVGGSLGNIQLTSFGNQIIFTGASTSNYIMSQHASSDLRFRTGGANDRIVIENDGDVGIGTQNPLAKLEVSGTGSVVSKITSTNNDARLLLSAQGAGGRDWYIQTGNTGSGLSGAFRIFDVNASASRLWIDTSGNIGVGTTSPVALLHINSSSAAGSLRIENTTGSSLLFVNGTSGYVGIGTTSPTSALTLGAASSRISIRTGTSVNDLLTIGGTQNQVITFNTNSGGTKIQLVGDRTGSGGGGDIRLSSDSLFGFTDSTNGGTLDTVFTRGSAGVVDITTGTAGQFRDLRLRALNPTDGTLGIGKINSSYLVDVNGTINAHLFLLNGTVFGGNNITGSGTTGYIPQWQSAGVLNNSVIYQNGTNVGIGTTSPASPLHVAGNITTPAVKSPAGTTTLTLSGDPNDITFGSILANVGNSGGFYIRGGGYLYTDYLAAEAGAPLTLMTVNNDANVIVDPHGTGSLYVNSRVGIGTSNPLALLQINGTNPANNLSLNVSGVLYVNSSANNVGIGTSIPSYKLDVAGSINAHSLLVNGTPFVGGGSSNSGGWTNTSTQTYTPLDVNISGNIYLNGSLFFGDGGGQGGTPAGNVSGGGAENYTARWSGVSSLTSGIIYDNGANIGIGTSNPARIFTISGAGASLGNSRVLLQTPFSGSTIGDGLDIISYNATGNAAVWNYENGNLSFATNNNERMVILSDGNIGIGTSNPGAKLDISSGDLYLTSDSNQQIRWRNSTGTFKGTIAHISTDDSIRIFTASDGSNAKVMINDNGNVGIGTTNPGAALTVSRSEGSGHIARLEREAEANLTIGAGEYISGVKSIYLGSTNALLLGSDDTGGLDGASADLIIKSGNTGIGTVAPSYKLDVNGTLNVHALLINGTPFSITSNITASGTAGYIPQFQNASTLNNSIIYQNGTNIGIGTTSVIGNFHVSFNSSTNATSSPNQLLVDNVNTDWDTGSLIKFTSRNAVGSVIGGAAIGAQFKARTDGQENADLLFVTRTAGSMTEKMRITASGNVGIGTSSPSTKLHVRDGAITINASTANTVDYYLGSGANNNIRWDASHGTIISSSAETVINIDSDNDDTTRYFAIQSNTVNRNTSREILRVQENGNVGIGTVSPQGILHIQSGDDGLIFNRSSEDVWDLGFGESASTPNNIAIRFDGSGTGDTGNSFQVYDFFTNTPRLTAQRGGNVGIGTPTPSTRLSVNATGITSYQKGNGTLLLQVPYSNGVINSIDFKHEVASQFEPVARIAVNHTSSGSFMMLGTSNNYGVGITNHGLVIDNNGRVGIGNPVPSYNLQIGNSTGQRILQLAGGNTAHQGQVISLLSSGSREGFIAQTNTNGALLIGNSAGLGGNYNDTNLANNANVAITSSGNVGIGTASPDRKFVVEQSANASVGYVYSTLDGGYAGSVFVIDSYSNRSSNFGLLQVRSDADNDGDGVQTHLYVSGNGNVGIGTTNPTSAFHVVGNANITGTTYVSNLDIAGVTFANGDVNASRDVNVGRNLNAVRNLTVSNNVLFASNLTGNVGIGTAAPSSKLEVSGGNATFNSGIILPATATSTFGTAQKVVFANWGSSTLPNESSGKWINVINFTLSGNWTAERIYVEGGGRTTGSSNEGNPFFIYVQARNNGSGTGVDTQVVYLKQLTSASSSIRDVNLVQRTNGGPNTLEVWVQFGTNWQDSFPVKVTYWGAGSIDFLSTVPQQHQDSPPSGFFVQHNRTHYDFSQDRLGIGTSVFNPNIMLAVGDASTGLNWTSTGNLSIVTNNVERARITTSGNVGIGTTTPTSKLFVNSTISGVLDLQSTTGQVNLGLKNWILYSGGTNDFSFYNGADRFTINSTGSVGVGTSSPTVKLYVNDSVSNSAIALDGVSSGSPYVSFRQQGNERAFIQYTEGGGSSDYLNYATSASAPHYFSGGSVGINTLTPTQRLHVNGSANVTGNIYYGGNLTGYGADFAEMMKTKGPVEFGDVVCLNDDMSVSKCTTRAQTSVAGIASPAPTIIGNAGNGGVAVGIVGIVKTKVAGKVNRFDMLTTSDNDGYAEKATVSDFGSIIGKAMEPCQSDTCIISVLVGLR